VSNDRPVYDFAERQQQKALTREADARAIASGEKTVEQVNRENAHFARLRVRHDWKAGRLS
jgi:hypothetical protein